MRRPTSRPAPTASIPSSWTTSGRSSACLEQAGIARLSLGPGLRWVPLSVMRQIAVELQGNGSFDLFTLGMITTDEIRQYVSKEPMK